MLQASREVKEWLSRDGVFDLDSLPTTLPPKLGRAIKGKKACPRQIFASQVCPRAEWGPTLSSATFQPAIQRPQQLEKGEDLAGACPPQLYLLTCSAVGSQADPVCLAPITGSSEPLPVCPTLGYFYFLKNSSLY